MKGRYFIGKVLATACIGMAAMQAASAAVEYRVTVVGPPDSRANAINNAGIIVGTFPANATFTRAFMSRGRGWVELGAPGVSTGANAINDRGEVLGFWRTPTGQGRGAIWYRGVQRDLGVVPGALGTSYVGIDNAGYTVVQATSGETTRSYLRAPGGALRDLGALFTTNPLTEAHAINNRNQVTGAAGEFSRPETPYRAFLWARGVLRDLGDFGSAPNEGNDINDRGQVVGYLAVPTGGPHDRVAFIYTNGRLRDIDGRPASGFRYSQAQGINNYRHAVGDSDHLSGWVYRGRRMQSLNALIDPASGWNIQLPRDINDAGQIAATGARNGQYYAVRLDLIRPHLETAPALDDADLPELLAPVPPAP